MLQGRWAPRAWASPLRPLAGAVALQGSWPQAAWQQQRRAASRGTQVRCTAGTASASLAAAAVHHSRASGPGQLRARALPSGLRCRPARLQYLLPAWQRRRCPPAQAGPCSRRRGQRCQAACAVGQRACNTCCPHGLLPAGVPLSPVALRYCNAVKDPPVSPDASLWQLFYDESGN